MKTIKLYYIKIEIIRKLFLTLFIFIFLIKFSVYSQVTEVWVSRYNGLGNGDDYASAIAMDDSGNVYVTGWSVGLGTAKDYATVKYNNMGIEQWVGRYNGPGDSDDYAYAIVVDGSGNVYVTGWSVGLGTAEDYATVKYNDDGIEQWVSRYNGPYNSNDEAYGIAVDTLENVYITGYCRITGASVDYTTIKYNSEGIEQWVAYYNGPENQYDFANGITLDDSGNIYVTGVSLGSGTSTDYATIKYNNMGIEQWVSRYNGPANEWEYAYAIAVDDYENVYVTGWSYGSPIYEEYATVKYDSAGIQQWVARYHGPGVGSNYALNVVVDKFGSVYVTGRSPGISYDYATLKYNSDGVQQWVARYNGPGNGEDSARPLAIDVSGSVYITGYSLGLGTSMDYATIKYNNEGIEQWVVRYNGSGNGDDYAKGIEVDSLGNVYVTGRSAGLGTSFDYVTIKYFQDVSINQDIWMHY